MNIICVWPDYTWCYLNEIGDYLWKSDDFEVVKINLTEEEIEEKIAQNLTLV